MSDVLKPLGKTKFLSIIRAYSKRSNPYYFCLIHTIDSHEASYNKIQTKSVSIGRFEMFIDNLMHLKIIHGLKEYLTLRHKRLMQFI